MGPFPRFNSQVKPRNAFSENVQMQKSNELQMKTFQNTVNKI